MRIGRWHGTHAPETRFAQGLDAKEAPATPTSGLAGNWYATVITIMGVVWQPALTDAKADATPLYQGFIRPGRVRRNVDVAPSSLATVALSIERFTLLKF